MKKTLEPILKELNAWTPVPKGLAHRIQKAVHKEAERAGHRFVFWSSVRLALGLCSVILGFTSLVVQWSYAEPLTYISSVWSEPSLMASWSGLRAFAEQVMLLPFLFFLGGLIYVVRHIMIRGLKSGRVLTSMMASLFVVVAVGSFFGGIAVGASGSESITAFASETILNPFVKPSSGFSYTAKGIVQSAKEESDLLILVTLELSNGDTKLIEVPKGVWKKHGDTMGGGLNQGFIGKEIFVVGDIGSMENSLRANFFKFVND